MLKPVCQKLLTRSESIELQCSVGRKNSRLRWTSPDPEDLGKVTSTMRRNILKARGERGQSTRKLGKKYGVDQATVSKVLKSAHLKPCHHPNPRPTQSRVTDAGRKKRVAFAKKHKDDRWDITLMTDECDFDLNETRNSKNDVVWESSPTEVPPVEKQRWTPKQSCGQGPGRGERR